MNRTSKVFLAGLSLFLLGAEVSADDYNIVEDITYTSSNVVIASASNQVLSYQNVLVQSGAAVIFLAGNQVVIQPGFHAAAGSNFTATTGNIVPTPAERKIYARSYRQPEPAIDAFDVPTGIALNVHRPAQ